MEQEEQDELNEIEEYARKKREQEAAEEVQFQTIFALENYNVSKSSG